MMNMKMVKMVNVKNNVKYMIVGIVLGSCVGGIGGYASELLSVTKANYSVIANGKKIDTTILNMDGRSYLNLRDIASVTGANVNWNKDKGQVEISSVVSEVVDKKPMGSVDVGVSPTPIPKLITLPDGSLEQYNPNDYLEGYLNVRKEITDKYNVFIDRVDNSLNLYKSVKDYNNRITPLLSDIPSTVKYGRLFISKEYFNNYILPIIKVFK